MSGLQWSNITYDVKSKRKPVDVEAGKEGQSIRILQGLSGQVRQGEYVGLLGASGAGKTTLVNILSARVGKEGKIGGTITFNDQPRNPATWKRSVGYVEQDDLLLSHLSVQETVDNAATLRLPSGGFSPAARAERVQEVIDMLRLDGFKDNRIGGEGEKGISGGERKRTSIAVELVSDVKLLFLDEPTSGLDAYAADRLVSNMSSIVHDRQLSCLMTIHQPSWAVFCKLDRVMLLAKGGVYYEGPPRDTIEYFESIGHRVPEGTNPADFFITIAENFERNDEGAKRVQELLDRWKERAPNSEIQSLNEKQVDSGGTWPQSWPVEFMVLFARWYRELVRDKPTLYATIGQTVILLIIVGFGFFRLGNSQADILPKIGVLVFIPINSTFAVIGPMITPFAMHRRLMIRERSSGLYRTSSFFFSKVLLELPNAILQRLIYFTVLYFMIGLRLDARAFFTYLGINIMHLANSVGLGLAIGGWSPTVQIANLLAPLATVIFLLFGGNFLPTPPPWFIWLKWISPINYTFSAMVQNEFGGQTLSCDGTSSSACFRNGDDIIRSYNLGTFTIAEDIGFLAALMFVYLLLGYIGLRWQGSPRLRFK